MDKEKYLGVAMESLKSMEAFYSDYGSRDIKDKYEVGKLYGGTLYWIPPGEHL